MANLYLVDVENICANPVPTQIELLNARLLLLHLTGGDENADHFVVGTHVGGSEAIRQYWPNRDSNGRNNRSRLNTRGGVSQKDGADRAIAHWVEANSDKLDEWDTVVIASGDHFFIPLAKELLTRGKIVKHVCLNPQSRSREWGSLLGRETYFISSVHRKFEEGLSELHHFQVEYFLLHGKIPSLKDWNEFYEKNKNKPTTDLDSEKD